MLSAADFIEDLQVNGQLTFTTSDVTRALGKPIPAVRAQLRRLKEKGRIADPYRGFYVVVPPKYRRLGCLPPDQFVPQLMEHLGEPYYVALLSAASYHGASHQAPMVFQVMVRKPRRGLSCAGVRVEFIARHDMEHTPVVVRNTLAGIVRIASPAATALELVGYPERCGHLDNVATVLAELVENVNSDELAVEALRAPVTWVQRLGYLLSLLKADTLADRLEAILKERNVFAVALAPWQGKTGSPKDPRWQVAINTEVEPDL